MTGGSGGNGFVSGEEARALLATEPVEAARILLGARLSANGVTVRIVEVEAYHGAEDPASHAYRGETPRNAVMFGPAGYLYVYRSYGIHTCMNVSTGVEGVGWAVLLRAGEVLAGHGVAAGRRPAARTVAQLGRGPGNLGSLLGIRLDDGGTDLLAAETPVSLELAPAGAVPDDEVRTGPRVGVSSNADVPWRLWLRDVPAVSAYRRSPRADPPAAAGDP